MLKINANEPLRTVEACASSNIQLLFSKSKSTVNKNLLMGNYANNGLVMTNQNAVNYSSDPNTLGAAFISMISILNSVYV